MLASTKNELIVVWVWLGTPAKIQHLPGAANEGRRNMQLRWFVPIRSIYSSRAQLKFRLVPILAFTKAGALPTHPIGQLQLQPQPS